MSIGKPSAGVILGATALIIALAGTNGAAEAAKLINGKLIKPNTVASKQIKDGTITAKDLSPSLRSSNGKGIVGPRGAKGETGPTGAAGAPGAAGADGAAIAVVSFEANGTKIFSKVNGKDLSCSSLCLQFYRVTVTKQGTGSYCVKVERNSGTLISPSWGAYVSALDHYGALVGLNGSAAGFAQQWTNCSGAGFEIRTYDATGTSADRKAVVTIF